MKKIKEKYSSTTYFVLGFFACIFVSKIFSLASPVVNGPVYSGEILREIINRENDGCRVNGFSGSSGKNGEWILAFTCPQGEVKSIPFTNAGTEVR